jgi:hypothetical protein
LTPTVTTSPPQLLNVTALPNVGGGLAELLGRGEPGATIQVLVNGQIEARTIVDADGNWAVRLPFNQPGRYQVIVRTVLADGTLLNAPTGAIVIVPTPIPTPTFTSRPANTRPPTPFVLNTPTPTPGTVVLVEPLNEDSGTGQRVFIWQTNFTPPPGRAFELVFWKEGQTPLQNGFGLAAPTTGTSVTVNLSKLDDQLGQMLDPGEYFWGLLLVQVEPYQRIQFLGESHLFTFFREGDSGSSGGGSNGDPPSSGE